MYIENESQSSVGRAMKALNRVGKEIKILGQQED